VILTHAHKERVLNFVSRLFIMLSRLHTHDLTKHMYIQTRLPYACVCVRVVKKENVFVNLLFMFV